MLSQATRGGDNRPSLPMAIRGFLTAEITFTNESEFPVHGVIIACDFLIRLTCI